MTTVFSLLRRNMNIFNLTTTQSPSLKLPRHTQPKRWTNRRVEDHVVTTATKLCYQESTRVIDRRRLLQCTNKPSDKVGRRHNRCDVPYNDFANFSYRRRVCVYTQLLCVGVTFDSMKYVTCCIFAFCSARFGYQINARLVLVYPSLCMQMGRVEVGFFLADGGGVGGWGWSLNVMQTKNDVVVDKMEQYGRL